MNELVLRLKLCESMKKIMSMHTMNIEKGILFEIMQNHKAYGSLELARDPSLKTNNHPPYKIIYNA
jgi:hypothetical protein